MMDDDDVTFRDKKQHKNKYMEKKKKDKYAE
jgi:hypothetical protein